MTNTWQLNPEELNTWQYELTTTRNFGTQVMSAKLTLGLTCVKSTSSASVFIVSNTNTSWFRTEIENYLKESLQDLSNSITPSKLDSLMKEEWALSFNPSYSYVPSISIISIVKPHTQQQPLPQTVIQEVAQQLNVSLAEAPEYAKYTQNLINSRAI